MAIEFSPVKFDTHEMYLSTLKRIKPFARYVELVQIYDGETDGVISYSSSHLKLIEKRKVNKWLGTKRGGQGVTKYILEINPEYWKYLHSFSSFFLNCTDSSGCDDVVQTEFGQIDIAFLDGERQPLFLQQLMRDMPALRKDYEHNS
ncbi:hypothetical protein [Lacrimispora sp.]|uniref:hypothetical protein n=1 Tax=Lacrimispora sp. TaxID=2719234 RepID=UPI00289C78EF|nr:hypothetical protein [Lacrimispora sp.]